MSLLAAYSFDEAGSTVTDYSGGGNDFSITGSSVARTASGHTAGGVTLGSTAAQMPAGLGKTALRTVMMWIKGTPGTQAWGISWYATALSSGCWGILFLNGFAAIQARTTSSSTPTRATQPTAWDGTAWHHVCGTYDGSNVRLYIDAVLTATAAFAPPIRTDNDLLYLGLTASGLTGDDLRIYDEALDQATIQAAMNAPVTGSAPAVPIFPISQYGSFH